MDTVSIPHRYGKNKMGAWHAHTPTEVSIPHRYGKNEVKDGYLYVIDGFPFLIGTVRTIQKHYINVGLKKFPFLIGTVRTYAWQTT